MKKYFNNTIDNILSVKQNDLIDKKQKQKTSGRQAWSVLHTFAAYLPDNISEDDQISFKNFFDSIIYYSSKTSAEWILNVENAKKNIHMDFTTRDSTCLSICHFHNYINWSLGKEQFPCSINNLNEIWGTNRT